MKSVTLANTSVTCSQLGFGCVTLTLHKDTLQALDLLAHVLDSGVTHFDVAPLYGFGQAEAILGDFIRTRRDRVTVATKFGMRPAGRLAKSRRLISIARKVSRWIPGLENRLRQRSRTMIRPPNFSATEALQSLEFSLKQLKTDHVDLFLLHEAGPADASRDDLLSFLEDQLARGTIREPGLGSAFERIGDDAARIPEPYTVLQFENNMVANTLPRLRNVAGRALITFGATGIGRRIVERARAHPDRAKDLRDHAGINPADPDTVTALLLRWAVEANPTGVVLFSSTSLQHVNANIRCIDDPGFSPEQLAAFARYVRDSFSQAREQRRSQVR
jgi:aryl-alcohol dehydrogenase-like predicted oxidoreductase